jgi:hypothetical protein
MMAAIFQLPVGLLGAIDQSGWVKTGATGKTDANGADGVGVAANWSHGFFKPRETPGKGPPERDLPAGKLGFGRETIGGTNAGGDAKFGALLFNSTGVTVERFDSGAERGFCDWSNIGADATWDALVGARGGAFTAKGECHGADDGLIAEGGAGRASSDIASGEI